MQQYTNKTTTLNIPNRQQNICQQSLCGKRKKIKVMSSAGRVNNQTVTDKQQQQSRLHETTRLAENMQIERRELEEAIKSSDRSRN